MSIVLNKDQSYKQIDIAQIQQSQHLADQEINNDFIDQYIGLIRSISGKLIQSGSVPKWVEFDDLVSLGIEGLIKAKKNFNEKIETKFQTYAYYRIKGEILDSVRKEWHQKMPREYHKKRKKEQEKLAHVFDMGVQSATGSSSQRLDEALESTAFARCMSNEIQFILNEKRGMRNPELDYVDENYEFIWKELDELPFQEKQVMQLIYVSELKQLEIADHLDISPSSVSRIHKSVIVKLRKRIKNKGAPI